ncbi:hypothetical protein BC833DRAFT_598000, partial [Globomyces pollinis-pini]
MINFVVAATIGGGCFFAGMNVCLIQTTLKEYGIHLNLGNDSHRQTVLCLVLLLGTVASILVYPLNEEGTQINIINVLAIILLTSVQFGLVIINHNTIFRFSATYPNNKFFKFILKNYGFLYIIPLFTMIPIYLAAYYSIPYNKTLNKHFYNINVFKPMNIGLVLGTEFLAVITDLSLLVRVGDVTDKRNLRNQTIQSDSNGFKRNWKKIRKYSKSGLWDEYYVIWGLLLLDITVKILIASGIRLLFDSAITITTMIMRARFNLRYTSLLKYMLENPKLKTTVVTRNLPARTETVMKGMNTLATDTVGFSNDLDSFLLDESVQFGMKAFDPLTTESLVKSSNGSKGTSTF